ncbi:uncharacterized protein LTR77_009612 [Saxophila tyrrhenica]|uniref:rRNA methyltransferase 1, mitochondrial n=1 Tax=Saxophila tyrrhenica TaxID=1690608 RepID=A0AAV9P206_9PEZI|nr:hypothetical protein LTR77_009612 [Saxophila tyrrhenica]
MSVTPGPAEGQPRHPRRTQGPSFPGMSVQKQQIEMRYEIPGEVSTGQREKAPRLPDPQTDQRDDMRSEAADGYIRRDNERALAQTRKGIPRASAALNTPVRQRDRRDRTQVRRDTVTQYQALRSPSADRYTTASRRKQALDDPEDLTVLDEVDDSKVLGKVYRPNKSRQSKRDILQAVAQKRKEGVAKEAQKIVKQETRGFDPAEDEDPLVRNVGSKLMRLKELVVELQMVETQQDINRKDLKRLIAPLQTKARRVEESAHQYMVGSGRGHDQAAQNLQAVAARLLASQLGQLFVSSSEKPKSSKKSVVWVKNVGALPSIEVVLSSHVKALLEDEAPKAKSDARKVEANPSTRQTPHEDDREFNQHDEPQRRVSNRSGSNATRRTAGEEDRVDDTMPLSVPRTTASSTFLYGTNTVLAALRARRRKVYALHFNTKVSSYEGDPSAEIRRLALQASIPTHPSASRILLNTMSEDRPHNGVVLEASHLPAPPVIGLGWPDLKTGDLPLHTRKQPSEERAVNGDPSSMRILTSDQTWRYPLVLMLDGILDPQNVGNIIRTAYFYGVDAVAVSLNTCCPLTSATLAKASSGACEAVQIFGLPKPGNFVYESKNAGWKIYAAAAPPPNSNERGVTKRGPRFVSHRAVAARSALERHPVILMLGAEGEGLRENLTQRADYFVGVAPGPRAPVPGRDGDGLLDVGVDSMNVGTAAAVLVDAFLRQPVRSTQHMAREEDAVGARGEGGEGE